MAKKKKVEEIIIHYADDEETICGEYTGIADGEAPIIHTTLKENVNCDDCLEELREIKKKKKKKKEKVKITDWAFTGTN